MYTKRLYMQLFEGAVFVLHDRLFEIAGEQWNEEVKVAVSLAIYHVCHQAPSLFLTNCNREDNIEARNL